MRMIRSAMLLTCGVALLSCNDTTAPARTQSTSPSKLEVPGFSLDGGSDLFVGHGETGFAGGASFTVSAHSGPLGEGPQGHLKLTLGTLVFVEGEVTCLAVLGNRAAAGAENPNGTGFDFFITVVDNGSPSWREPPDLVGLVSGPAANQAGCDEVLAILPMNPVLQGNFTVKDADLDVP
jgi:hypothetical protein